MGRRFLERLTGAQRVFGEPIERDGVTVIPAAAVRFGGGFGSGSGEGPNDQGGRGEGGGGGLSATPVGVYVIKDGQVRWEPAIDLNRIILGGQLIALVSLIVVARLLRRRLRR